MESLSDRERETLRLLGRGHEAKSIASAFGLSVHTVNERLRAARRKLGVSSSREAARLLLAHEQGPAPPDKPGYKEIGVAPAGAGEPHSLPAHSGATGARRPATYVVIGIIMLFLLASLLMTLPAGRNDAPAPDVARPAQAMRSLPSLFETADYPAEALARNVQGSTGYRLQLSDSGRVEKCDIQRSSGSAALDQATCRVLTARSRFRPELDSAGRPVGSVFNGTIHWRLGEGPGAEARARP